MTQYYTTACDTGTCSGCYDDHWHRNSTTVASTGYNNWSDTPVQTDTTSSSIPYYWTHTGTGYNIPYMYPYTQSEKTPDRPSEQELLRRREERAEAEEIAKKAQEEAAKAEEKARILLLEYLDNENRQRLLDRKPLEVPSRLFGDIKYHIPISNGRIEAWKESKVVTELCLAVRESGCLPTDDIVLTKLLHVLHDEENMLRTANHFETKENLLARLRVKPIENVMPSVVIMSN